MQESWMSTMRDVSRAGRRQQSISVRSSIAWASTTARSWLSSAEDMSMGGATPRAVAMQGLGSRTPLSSATNMQRICLETSGSWLAMTRKCLMAEKFRRRSGPRRVSVSTSTSPSTRARLMMPRRPGKHQIARSSRPGSTSAFLIGSIAERVTKPTLQSWGASSKIRRSTWWRSRSLAQRSADVRSATDGFPSSPLGERRFSSGRVIWTSKC
mmetsp:Transcript_101327/g.254066  ORF Transcript_101327/g.254066 Transcript_101327/m.254066 type:complete len:212 (-) Transcript_101327:991-1626(-)